jgi:SAM-dependent methyltransferase
VNDAPGWWLDELAHAGPEHLDAAYVSGYDRKASTDFSVDVELLTGLGMDGSSTLVDLGCGTGGLALAAAGICRRVVAVDVSAAMLDALAARARDRGLDALEVVRAGFLTYEHRGEPADFVYSRNALHHLPDFWKAVALRRAAAILRPGGVLQLRDLVYGFEPEEAEAAVEAWLDRAAARPEDGWTRPELETHLREEHSTYDWLLRPMLERAGFEIRRAEVAGTRTYAAYTCVRVMPPGT